MLNRSSSYVSLLLSLAATAALVLSQGCDGSSIDPFGSPSEQFDAPASAGSGDGESSSYPYDAATPPAAPFRGSMLCRVTDEKCMPDDDGKSASTNIQICKTSDAAIEGCRLAGAAGNVVPDCFDATATGVDGVSCRSGAGCAPGFDCVDQPEGAVCRRYCCAGSCKEQKSQNGSSTFCDIQKLVGPNAAKAPVCMPLKRCTLLTAGECADKETCSVVTEQGETGCVANGNAKAGESCESDHCNAGLTCLGTPGSRTCYQLCKTDGSVPCGATQTCKTNTLFASSAYGVCKDITSASY